MRGSSVVSSNLGWVDFLINEMNNMHLKVHQLTVDRVLGWRMEMELLSKEICLLDMWIEKTNSRGAQEVLRGQVVSWLLGCLQGEEEGFNRLVEFVRGFWINCFVVEIELIVGKILEIW